MERQRGLFDGIDEPAAPRLPFSNDTTSKAAAESMAALAGGDEARVLSLIQEHGGLTCYRIEEISGLSHQTASARVRGLAKKKMVIDGGRQGVTRTGRRAIIWESNVPNE